MIERPNTPFQVLGTVKVNGKEFHPEELREAMQSVWRQLQSAHDKPKQAKVRAVKFLLAGNEFCPIFNKRQVRSLISVLE
jgi:hypothetical protein